MSTRLVQLRHGNVRRVALVEEPHLRLLSDVSSIYALAKAAVSSGMELSEAALQKASRERLDYDPVYNGQSEWRILPAIDHPDEPARCLVSGTGLTHLGSARNRQAMHARAEAAEDVEQLTDSMKMFRWGIDGGRPAAGCIGVSPEWFYKGNGVILRAHGEPLEIPDHADDGGEEAEIAGVYFIAADGGPCRIGMTAGNEFSDHRFEKKNYLNLASSKLRTCAIGPELVVDADFESVPGEIVIKRDRRPLWSRQIRTGEAEMCHSLQNIEHHHFKFAQHRRPGDVHVHFFGADCLSFGDGIQLQHGDVMQISFEGFGRPLRNPVQHTKAAPALVSVVTLG
ncbi:MAG TPA: AraD1 family protein [Terriglobales bacterium]|nr:AraD1 family protein [Terriglobales bacterium]